MLIMNFSCYKRVYKMRCSAILGCFWILWSELEENRRLSCKTRHMERQNDFWTKNANNILSSKIWKYQTDVHLHIAKLKSRGHQLPVMKKNRPGKRFNLEKSSFFFIKSTKNIRFYPNQRMPNSYTFVLSRIKMKSLFLTINKRKKSLHTLYSQKK